METHHISELEKLYFKHFASKCTKIEQLPKSGSDRIYFRMSAEQNKSILGVFNPHIQENICFIQYAKHFEAKSLNTPQVLYSSNSKLYYLVEDLGHSSLHDYFTKANKTQDWDNTTINLMEDAIRNLAKLQIIGDTDLDYTIAYPIPSFDQRSVMWDLNYFKYNLLKPKNISFDELQLEKDFETFCSWLLQERPRAFLFRDFQSRNIIIQENKSFFIDFQGGRKGPLQYDVASFLWQVSANIPDALRNQLVDTYLQEISTYIEIDQDRFKEDLNGFVFFRLLQVLGAYGYRGLFEHKPHFLKSLPLALVALKKHIEKNGLPIKLPELERITKQLTAPKSNTNSPKKLQILISSFSYLVSGIPKDPSPNGGGHVFDCRFLPNPGRIEQYKRQTGMDKEVINYLEKKEEVGAFLDASFKIIDAAVENYLDRGFSNLMISFGCTGGQHRSVYSAEQTFKHLKQKYNVNLTVDHIMQNVRYTST